MPLTLLKIQSGTLKEMDFDFTADRKSAKGKLVMLYNDVKVAVLRRDSMFNSLQAIPVPTLYINNFILKHSNPTEPGQTPRVAFVTENRATETPFFKYTWQTMLEGIKPSIGLDRKTQEATEALINQLTADKRERQVKKVERQQRRAERRLRRAQTKSEDGNN